ncbi:MAG: hypothetical protein OHM77_05480 [Candidatus Nitricoxidivorans perseverans]|uniref:Uncharacterized protein n=1 Tax=Candidatus Nitricoxidivorans perseverans TaxID=2975601 RepID=A0AA49IZB8_9PROT|nr:MAG: hypothetical protein OHM77_05480 [Candidatus Nitricoxidivorans perseverans]
MLQRMAIERNLSSLDERIRSKMNSNQQRVVEKIQQNALELKQTAVYQREGFLGTFVDLFA